METRLEKAGLWVIGLFLVDLVGILAWKLLREGIDPVFGERGLVLETWERAVVTVPIGLLVLWLVATRLQEGWRFLAGSYHEGRTLFVERIFAAREAPLLGRVARLERQLAGIGMRDGVLHARGLEITDAQGAPILTVGKTEHGATMLTVGGEARGTAASLVVNEQGSCIDLRDAAGRLRVRAAVSRDDVWLTLQDAEEEPRAGFLVKAGSPRLLLHDPSGPDATGGPASPGYL